MGVSVLEYTPRKGIKRLEEVLPKLYLLKIMSTKSFDLNYSISFLNPNVLISNLYENRIFQIKKRYCNTIFKCVIYQMHSNGTSGMRGLVRNCLGTLQICDTIYRVILRKKDYF